MPILQEGPFNSYSFTKEEYPFAVTFTELQLAHIQSQLAELATQKNNIVLRVDLGPSAADIFIKEHEFLRGGIAALEYLIAVHESAEELRKEAAENAEAQLSFDNLRK